MAINRSRPAQMDGRSERGSVRFGVILATAAELFSGTTMGRTAAVKNF
jgi:hypothetical protein